MCYDKSAWPIASSLYRVLPGTNVLLLLVIVIGNGPTEARVEPYARVIGGEPVPDGRFPYMCSIRYRGGREHACGGTLIKSKWVLTAAHCVDPTFRNSAGMSPLIFCDIYERDEDKDEKEYSAVETHIHCEWNGSVENGFDIALIKLDKKADLVIPDLAVFGHVPGPGSKLAAIGWGANETHQATDRLQIVTDLIPKTKNICNKNETWYGLISDSMICAGAHHKDAASGDSGGPLLQLDYVDGDYRQGKPSSDLIVGVTAFGASPPGSAPGVYISVGAFAKWIEEVTKGNAISCPPPPPPPPPSPSLPLKNSVPAPESLPAESPIVPEPEGVIFCVDGFMNDDFNEEDSLKRIREAIREDDKDAVEGIIVCENIDPNVLYERTDTFLLTVQTYLVHEAAEYDAVRSTRVLIAKGADLSKTDSRGRSPLHVAAEHNALQVAKVLFNRGADLEAQARRNDTPLHFATWWGFDAFVEFLLEKGAYVDSKNSNGETPLHLAASGGFVSVVELLLENGASKVAETDKRETPFDVVCRGTENSAPCTSFIRDELEELLRCQ